MPRPRRPRSSATRFDESSGRRARAHPGRLLRSRGGAEKRRRTPSPARALRSRPGRLRARRRAIRSHLPPVNRLRQRSHSGRSGSRSCGSRGCSESVQTVDRPATSRPSTEAAISHPDPRAKRKTPPVLLGVALGCRGSAHLRLLVLTGDLEFRPRSGSSQQRTLGVSFGRIRHAFDPSASTVRRFHRYPCLTRFAV